MQVRLSPVIARAVLGASPAELDDAVVPLEDLWGREAARIREQLGDVPSWQDRFALTDTLLARRHEAGPPVDHAAHRLVAGESAARVAADAGYADQSHLHLMEFTGAIPAAVAGEPFLAVDDIAWPSRGTPAKPQVSRKCDPVAGRRCDGCRSERRRDHLRGAGPAVLGGFCVGPALRADVPGPMEARGRSAS
ncbi:hypothetical protein ACFVYT_17160 [Streptomyces sp. NPDC058290]|uniref:hypothetical protein n=1 Tax=Streptomyces sp. NPDC058290 TaxID=3346426 RepID=UPI0036F0D5F6